MARRSRHGRRIVGATIEFGGGLDPNDHCELAVLDTDADVTCWFLVGDETRAAARSSSTHGDRPVGSPAWPSSSTSG